MYTDKLSLTTWVTCAIYVDFISQKPRSTPQLHYINFIVVNISSFVICSDSYSPLDTVQDVAADNLSIYYIRFSSC